MCNLGMYVLCVRLKDRSYSMSFLAPLPSCTDYGITQKYFLSESVSSSASEEVVIQVFQKNRQVEMDWHC